MTDASTIGTRVALVSPIGVQGGAERALVSLARHFPRHGLTPTAILLQDGPLRDWFEAVGCSVTVVPAGRWRRLDRTVMTVARLGRQFRDLDVAAVIANQSKAHIYCSPAARRARIPSLWWQHGLPTRTPIELIAGRLPAAAVICANSFTATNQRARTPRATIVTIPYGIAISDVVAAGGRGAAVRDELGWTGHAVIGVVGRVQRWKGQHVFLEAAAKVAAVRPDVRFAIVGGAVIGNEGSYPDELRTMADRLGIADVVTFTGHQPDVYPWLAALDIAAHTSFGEPFGLVIVEAMALGKPVIAAAEGGPLDIVRDGVDGLLVPAGDPDLLAASMVRLLDDDVLSRRLGAEARHRATLFDESVMAQRWADVVHQAVRSRPVTQPP